jgi:hypothetical protein
MTESPYLLRVFPGGGNAPIQVHPCQTEPEARGKAQAFLAELPDQSTVEIWQHRASDPLYELLVGYDKLFQPTIYEYDASMLEEDIERVRWDGSPTTYLYQPETF